MFASHSKKLMQANFSYCLFWNSKINYLGKEKSVFILLGQEKRKKKTSAGVRLAGLHQFDQASRGILSLDLALTFQQDLFES